jgi:hypothetical protein
MVLREPRKPKLIGITDHSLSVFPVQPLCTTRHPIRTEFYLCTFVQPNHRLASPLHGIPGEIVHSFDFVKIRI